MHISNAETTLRILNHAQRVQLEVLYDLKQINSKQFWGPSRYGVRPPEWGIRVWCINYSATSPSTTHSYFECLFWWNRPLLCTLKEAESELWCIKARGTVCHHTRMCCVRTLFPPFPIWMKIYYWPFIPRKRNTKTQMRRINCSVH